MADQSNEMGMVERVAQALFDPTNRRDLAKVPSGVQSFYEDMARAAIEAMREPSKAMVAAADMAIDNNIQQLDVAKIAYIAAIDAALSHDEVKG